MWINPNTLQVYRSNYEIRKAWPNTSLPTVPTDELLEELFELKPIVEIDSPTYSSFTHSLREVPPRLIEGQWTQQWEVIPLTDEKLKTWRSSLVLTPRQANSILLQNGLLDQIEYWISTQSRQVQIDWNKATEIRRDWPLINNSINELGLTETQLDELFIAGCNII